MKAHLKSYFELTKTGIIVFTLVSALAGYAVSFDMSQDFEWWQPALLILGLYLVSAGSFALNQAQEWRRDALMDRTLKRPIPQGHISPTQGYLISLLLLLPGLTVLWLLGTYPAALALFTVVLYNLVYTLFLKRKWVFGAVPGAIPGAMPVVIGYSVNSERIFQSECLYLFLLMFLWQMPHFWSLAIRYKDDYQKGGFPVLPVQVGIPRALYHVGLYVFAYVGVALLEPFFLKGHILYLLLVWPISMKVLWEFLKFYRRQEAKAWLPFFLWTNLSLLIYLATPVMDRWLWVLWERNV